MSERFYNRKTQKEFRKVLRRDMPPAERLLWNHLRKSQLDGCKFRRQHGIGNYIADFYCPSKNLVIEIDGDSHFEDGARRRDLDRDTYFQDNGLMVVRFTNDEVYQDIERVLEDIRRMLIAPTPSGSPLERGRDAV